MTDLGAAEVHVVFPVRREVDEAQLAGLVEHLLVVQVTQAHQPQQPVQLVDRHYRRRRVVDRRRQGLDRDVDQDAQGEGRILLHGALAAERDRGAQPPVVGIVSGSQMLATPEKSPSRTAAGGTEKVRVSERRIRWPS